MNIEDAKNWNLFGYQSIFVTMKGYPFHMM